MGDPAHISAAKVPTRLGPLHVQTVGSGPPAVLWHSLFVDSTTWVRVAQPLAATRRLVLIDGPAHGDNPPVPHRFTLDDCVGAAADVLDHFGIDEPVDWLGNAWGGHVGILFAAAHPGRCRTLTAIGAPVHALTAAERRQTVLLSSLYRITGPVRPLVNTLVDALLGPCARADDAEGAALVADAFRRADRRGMYAAIRWLSLGRRDLTPVLDTIGAPTLLTTGAHDPMWTTTNAHAAAAHLPQGGLVILPGAGHIGPLLQAPSNVAELVTGFWREPAAQVAHHRDAPAPPAARPLTT
jgi:pimeloyl-ACP methyl ester carboxylesterase